MKHIYTTFKQFITKPLLVACALLAMSGNVWGYSYTSLTVNAEGKGKVAITRNNSAPSASSYQSSASDNQNHNSFWDKLVKDTYYVWVSPESGYRFKEFSSSATASVSKQNSGSYKVTITGSPITISATLTATFVTDFYVYAESNATPASCGGTYVSCNGNWPANDAEYKNQDTSTRDIESSSNPASCNVNFRAKAASGYSFAGWYTGSNGTGTKINNNAKYTETFSVSSNNKNDRSKLIRYAYFTPNNYKIYFYLSENDYSSWKNSTVTFGNTYGSGTGGWPTPTKDGYTFAGWYDGSTKISSTSSYTKAGDSYLDAHWNANYTVVFNGNENTGGSMTDQAFQYSVPQALTANAFERKYEVSYDANGGDAVESTIANYTFAGWEDRGSIKHNNKTYEYTTFDAPYYANTNSDLYTAFGYDKYALINHYVTFGKSEGRKIIGENPGLYPNQAVVSNLITDVNGSVNLYAHWNSTAVTLPKPTRDGYYFEGWYDAEDNKVGDAGASYTPTADVEFKAKWTKIETPVFKLNGTDIAENGTIDAELNLLVGEKANMAFENIDANFTYPTSTTEVKYTHNTSAKTGVIEALKAGSATFTFNQPVAKYIYAHARTIKVKVAKHPVILTTTLDNTECDVFTAFNLNDIYTLTTPAGTGEPAQNEITVKSSNEDAIKFVDGKWRAVGEGTTTLTIAQVTNDYWTGDTITAIVTVNKINPSINPNISAATITYGQALSASTFTGTIAVSNTGETENAATTCTWKNSTSVLAAGDRTETVVFQSTHTNWFNAVEIENVPVKVEKANPTVAATRTLIYGQKLSEVGFTNATTGVREEDGIISGEINWKEAVNEDVILAIGDHNYAITFTSSNDNYNNGEGVCVVIVTQGFVFKGSEDNSDWNEATNWLNNNKPGTDERVTVDANVDVTGDVTVAGLTINAGNTVTIKDGASLTIGSFPSLTRDTYGNIIVEAGGKLNLTGGTLQINDYELHSGFDNSQPKSGQTRGQDKLHTNGNAYFVLDLDPNGKVSYGWYSFTVPFEVNALTGVDYYFNGTWTQMTNEVNYAIMDYHEDLRAQGKYGWKKYRATLHPNTGYIITVDDELGGETGVNTIRFRKDAGAAFNTEMTQQLTATVVEGGATKDQGWNYVGNGTTSYINYGSATLYAQVLNHAANVYDIDLVQSNNMVVGAAYVVQVHENSVLTMQSAYDATTGLLRAPKREDVTTGMINLLLSANGKNADRLFVTYGDEAEATYTIGRDVQKMGTTVGASCPRIWANAKQDKLAAVDMAFVENQVLVPLGIYVPQAGDYTIAMADYAEEDVYLLHNGGVVADLSISDHTLSLNAGTDNDYSLLIVRRVHAVATGVDNLDNNANSGTEFVEKIMMNGQLFILHNGTMFDVQGRKVATF